MSDNNRGRLVFLPDIEYKAWVNRNEEMVADIIKTGKIDVIWLRKDRNKEFLVRRLNELGYSIDLS